MVLQFTSWTSGLSSVANSVVRFIPCIGKTKKPKEAKGAYAENKGQFTQLINIAEMRCNGNTHTVM